MDLTKQRVALEDLIEKRDILNEAIAQLTNVLHALNGGKASETGKRASEPSTYIEDVLRILASTGRPLHVDKIRKVMQEERGREIARPSLESSILRHIKANKPGVKALGKSTYAPGFWAIEGESEGKIEDDMDAREKRRHTLSGLSNIS